MVAHRLIRCFFNESPPVLKHRGNQGVMMLFVLPLGSSAKYKLCWLISSGNCDKAPVSLAFKEKFKMRTHIFFSFVNNLTTLASCERAQTNRTLGFTGSM